MMEEEKSRERPNRREESQSQQPDIFNFNKACEGIVFKFIRMGEIEGDKTAASGFRSAFRHLELTDSK